MITIGRKCSFITFVTGSVTIVFILLQIPGLELFLNWNTFKDGRFSYFDSLNALDNCVISFLVLNGLGRHLEYPNNTYPFYQSFHRRPLKYDNIGKECASKIYEGQYNKTMKKYLKSCFYPFQITTTRRALLQKSLALIKKSFQEHNLELVLTGGSFIGSWRYHQMIPYDDDIDFYILHEQKPEIRELLEDLSLNKKNRLVFRDTELSNQHWKLGVLCNNRHIESCWLQIDFFFMWQEGNEMRFLEAPGSLKVVDYYPLKWRPFENVLFQSPNNFGAYVKRQYLDNSSNVCQFKNHAENGLPCLMSRVDCDYLRFMYPYKLTVVHMTRKVEIIVYRMTVTSLYISLN